MFWPPLMTRCWPVSLVMSQSNKRGLGGRKRVRQGERGRPVHPVQRQGYTRPDGLLKGARQARGDCRRLRREGADRYCQSRG